ncbi:MAG: DNA-binding protein [Solirubrobacterales bacterium]|nr:DNA-binding protein [Solirubrobacterales bacterium]
MAIEPAHRISAAVVGPRLTREDVLTVREVSELLRCSTRHVYVLAERGELPGARRLGRKLLVSRRVLEAWLLTDADAV